MAPLKRWIDAVQPPGGSDLFIIYNSGFITGQTIVFDGREAQNLIALKRVLLANSQNRHIAEVTAVRLELPLPQKPNC
jgi:hypothetical protein